MSSPLQTGVRVRLASDCPIESEGVAPHPGDEGELVAAPRRGDGARHWLVRFDRDPTPWSMPERFLRPIDRAH